MGDGRDLGRNAAEDVSRRQINESSSAAVDEVFAQWQALQNDPAQIIAFKEELAPYLPQLSVAFLNRTVEIDGVATTYFDAIDESGDGILQDTELQDFMGSTPDGAARMFADYLLQHYSAFDASDGIANDGINKENLMRSEEGFYNSTDGSYTRLTEEGVFETYYSDGIRLTMGGTSAASAVYTVPGPPEMTLASQGGGDGWTVSIAGQPPITYTVHGEIEHTNDGLVVTRADGSSDLFQDDRVITRDAAGNRLTEYEYDSSGQLVNYWQGEQHWWMDRRGLATLTNGTWYLEGTIPESETRRDASDVYMDPVGNVVFEYSDGYVRTIRRDGDVSWSSPVMNPITGAEIEGMTVSITRDQSGQIVEVQAPPFTQPWTYDDGGTENPDDDHWELFGVNSSMQPTITFNDDGSEVPGFTVTFPDVEGGSRQYQYDAGGQLRAIVNPDGSSFRLENGQYLYYESADDTTGEPAQLTLSGNKIVFTLGEPPASTFEYTSTGTERLTVAQGETVFVETDGERIDTVIHNADGTTVRIEPTMVTVTNANGTAVQYRQLGDHWVAVSGTADGEGMFIPNNVQDPGQNVRAGFDSAGNFVVFQDIDGNLGTFDPGAEYQVISPQGVITDLPLSNYSGTIAFIDENQIENSMVFTNGQITGVEQTTPGGQHISVQVVDGNITSIQLPDGTQILPVVENGTVRWQHSGNPQYYLAYEPVIGANGEILVGTSSIWSMQSPTDVHYPGQLVLQIPTEDGIQYLAMDGSFRIGDSTNTAIYAPGNVLTEQVFGNYRDRSQSVVVTYGADGQPTNIDLPGDGRAWVSDSGVWYYEENGVRTQLLAAPVISESGVVSFNFAQLVEGGVAGLRIGPNTFYERIASDGAVRAVDPADDSITDLYRESGIVVERASNNDITSITFPDGARYDRVSGSVPPEWIATIGGRTYNVTGEIVFDPAEQTVTVGDGNNHTTYQFENGEIVSVSQVQGDLRTITSFAGGEITLVTMTDSTGATQTLQPRQEGGTTVWHWTHADGADSLLPRNTTVSLDGAGGIIFTNPEAFEGTVSLIGADGNWHIPEPSGFNPLYTDTQLTSLTLPDQQGTWTMISTPPAAEKWQFTGSDGGVVEREGHLTFDATGTVIFEGDGIREEFTYTGPGGAIERISITDANGATTVATYSNGEIVSISLPAGGTMSRSGDFWTVSIGGVTVNVLGTPDIVNGQLVMVNNNVASPVFDADAAEMQFVTLEGTISINNNGVMVATDQSAIQSRMAEDISWIVGVEQMSGADGVLTLADLQRALEDPTLTADQREVVLYLMQNYDQLQPLYDPIAGTLTVLSADGVDVYGPAPGEVLWLGEGDLLFLVNPNDSASLWTRLAPNGVLTRESLDSIVATGMIGDYTLTPMERAAAFYLQANWAQLATEGEEMMVAAEIQAASLLAYARIEGINFPDAALTADQPSDDAAAAAPIVGDPVEITSLNGGGGDVQPEPTVLPASYDSVDWLNQNQLVMRQYMFVNETGQRTGAIDQTRVDAQVAEFDRRGYENLTDDEKLLYDSLKAMQAYFVNTQPPYMAEDFFRSILLSGDAASSDIGARTLQSGDTVWSMARRFLVEQYCLQHGLDPEEQMRMIEQGYGANPDLASYVNANLQAEIDFIFEANNIVGNNIANGQLLILDPALAGQNNDAVYLAPSAVDFSSFTEVPSEGQSTHVTHRVNESTGEEAYMLDNGISLTRSATGAWGAYDQNGHFLGLVENNYVDPEAIMSGNFTLRLESNGDVPIDSIIVTDEVTTIDFVNGSSEEIYRNGVQVYRSPAGEVDQVVVETALGPVTYRRLVSNGVTTGYQVVYEDGTVANTSQAPLPAANGTITFLSLYGQAVTVDAHGNSTYGGIGFQPPASEVEQEGDLAA